ncbi:uridine kinase [Streptomyces sp. GBA 94-10 4N24]|uniref:uridine kinase family protein n=1 Tax=Streptomyces sp. GBA 94-10 4N24 TaxID=1218177 RepID=UPI0003C31B20|nr:uridine kinase [Streptomyces sp. GBA 94-10 4N24]ESP99163.1 uridine kinase [Streptomyces sp. GBA 94-10 4N24]UZN59671.1 uridine kinase [Streptomyces sp. GBA 94-10 4N24]
MAEPSSGDLAPYPLFDVAAYAARVRARAKARGGHFLLGVDGPGASGKSTLAGQLARHLPESHVVHVDDFYLPSADRARAGTPVVPGFDLRRLREQVLAPAAGGEPVAYERYDWGSGRLGERIEVPARAPLIVEGVYSTHLAARAYYHHRLFCRAARELRLRRGLERDGAAAEPLWRGEWMPAEDDYVAAERPDLAADAVLSSDRETAGDDGPRYWNTARRTAR